MAFREAVLSLWGHNRVSFTPMTRDEQIMLGLIHQAGYTVEREALTNRIGPTTYRVTAGDDDGHLQIVDAGDELTALVELAKRLGFEDMD